MNKTTSLAVLIAGFALAGASTAQAQDAQAFVDINAGAQTQSRTLTSSANIPLYGETAAINGAQSIESGGLFDISGGYRVTPSLAVGIGFSVFSSTGEGTIVASVPSPEAFNRAVVVTTSASGLKHREVGTHLMAVYFLPLMDKLDASVFAGPSFFRLSQDVISATIPAGTQTTSVTSQKESATATGVNIGINFNYMVTPMYGGGLFIRYAGATADLPSAGELKVGGFQVGAGLRLRF